MEYWINSSTMDLKLNLSQTIILTFNSSLSRHSISHNSNSYSRWFLLLMTGYLLLLILVSSLLTAVLRAYQRSLSLLSLTPLNILNGYLVELTNLWVVANNLVVLVRMWVAVFSFTVFQLVVVVFQTLPCALCGLSFAMAVLRLLYVTRFSQVLYR